MINDINPQLEALKTQLDGIRDLKSADKPGEAAPGFDEILDQLKSVDDLQKEADLSIRQLASGENTSIQDVVMKLEEADVAFQLMKEVRNKLLEAYKDVLSMSS